MIMIKNGRRILKSRDIERILNYNGFYPERQNGFKQAVDKVCVDAETETVVRKKQRDVRFVARNFLITLLSFVETCVVRHVFAVDKDVSAVFVFFVRNGEQYLAPT